MKDLTVSRRAMGVASLLEQLNRRIYANEGPTGLKPAQWAALRFFLMAGKDTRTVSGLARFMGTTTGPASRSVKALVGRKLLDAKAHPTDKRSTVFELTDKARFLLENDPIIDLALSVSNMEVGKLEQLAECLVEIGTLLETRRQGSDE